MSIVWTNKDSLILIDLAENYNGRGDSLRYSVSDLKYDSSVDLFLGKVLIFTISESKFLL